MALDRDPKDQFGSDLPSNSDTGGKDQTPGDFTKAFFADAGSNGPEQGLDSDKSLPLSDFKVQHDDTAGDFTRLFDGLKTAKPAAPVNEGVNSLDSAPTLSFQIPPAAQSPRKEEKAVQEPGEFTRAFSESGKPVQWHRDGDQGTGLPPVGSGYSPFGAEDFGTKSAPKPVEEPFKTKPSTDDFTSVFQRALGSQAPKPSSPGAFTPPLPEPADKQIFAPFEQPQQTGRSQNWGPPPQEPLKNPGEFTTFMNRLEPSGAALPEAPRGPIAPTGRSANDGATDIFRMNPEPAAPAPAADLGPSKFTQFMKLSEIRAAEEKFSEAEAAAGTPPGGSLPNLTWAPPQAPAVPAPPAPPAPAMPTPNFQPAPVQPMPQMPAVPSLPPQPFPVAVPLPAVPQAPPRPAPPTPAPSAPPSKLVTYLPLILILNGLFLAAILLVVLFALKK